MIKYGRPLTNYNASKSTESFSKVSDSNITLGESVRISQEYPKQSVLRTNFLEPLRQSKIMSASGALTVINLLREPLVEYQSSRGFPKDEHITFMNLLTSLLTQSYTAALTILVMLWNLLPLVEGFLYFARFILDKLVDIIETGDPKEKAMKTIVFCGEMFVILIIIFLIVGLIFMSVYVLTARLFGKLWGMIIW